MQSELFSQLVRVPKCCEAKPWEDKCLPCRKCVTAWAVWHRVGELRDYWDDEQQLSTELDNQLREAMFMVEAEYSHTLRLRLPDGQERLLEQVKDVYRDKKGVYVHFTSRAAAQRAHPDWPDDIIVFGGTVVGSS